MLRLKWLGIGLLVWFFGGAFLEIAVMPMSSVNGLLGAIAGVAIGVWGYRREKAARNEFTANTDVIQR